MTSAGQGGPLISLTLGSMLIVAPSITAFTSRGPRDKAHSDQLAEVRCPKFSGLSLPVGQGTRKLWHGLGYHGIYQHRLDVPRNSCFLKLISAFFSCAL